MDNKRIYLDRNSDLYSTTGSLDLIKAISYPALLVCEPSGAGDQMARVAHLTNISQGSKKMTIHYVFDDTVPSIPSRNLESYSDAFQLNHFRHYHSCWRFCDMDLYRLLLTDHFSTGRSPKVFDLNRSMREREDLVSVMMPFDHKFDKVYGALQEAATELSMECLRADDIWEDEVLIQDVINLIIRARVVICDCTGKNPNVFYGAGIAHTIGKNVILITQHDSDIPFDLLHLRYLPCLANNEGLQKLSKDLTSRLQSLLDL